MTDRTVTSNGTPVHTAGAPDARRALIVIQEAFGVNDHIRDVTTRFGDHGFYAVAPELFHRGGSPVIAYNEFDLAIKAMGALTRETLTEDLTGTVNYLHQQGFVTNNIGIVGYCMGGTVALFAATLGIVGGACSFYGGGVATGRFGLPPLVELAPHLVAPWLGLYGDLDAGIPVEQVESLRAAAATANVATDVVRYADADHGFHCDARPQSFNEVAAADAAARALEFFERVLVER